MRFDEALWTPANTLHMSDSYHDFKVWPFYRMHERQ
jgi:hypothetical protein